MLSAACKALVTSIADLWTLMPPCRLIAGRQELPAKADAESQGGGCYLLSGGLGSLGILATRWLSQQRRVCSCSRPCYTRCSIASLTHLLHLQSDRRVAHHAEKLWQVLLSGAATDIHVSFADQSCNLAGKCCGFAGARWQRRRRQGGLAFCSRR